MTRNSRDRLVLATTLVLALVFWHSPVLLPARVLVVVFHEVGHALAALATGGSVVSMNVGLDEGGATLTRGGWPLVILNGGYLGSLLFGVLLLLASRRAGSGRFVAGMLGSTLVGVAVLWFRPVLSIGFAYALLAGVAVLLLASKAPPAASDLAVRFVGIFSVLYAFFDIRDDVLRWGGSGQSDAAQLAAMTWLPAPVWGLLWMGAGATVLWKLRRKLG